MHLRTIFSLAGCLTAQARCLVRTCRLVRRLREALQTRAWDDLAACLGDASEPDAALDPVSAGELLAAKYELQNRTIVLSLTAGLERGMAAGPIGHLDPGYVSQRSLFERELPRSL